MGSNQSTSLLLVLARCEQAMVDMLRPALNEIGISLEQWRVISTLRQVEYMSIDDVVRSLGSIREFIDSARGPTHRHEHGPTAGGPGRSAESRCRAHEEGVGGLPTSCAKAEEDCLTTALDPMSKTGRNLAELVEFVEKAAADR